MFRPDKHNKIMLGRGRRAVKIFECVRWDTVWNTVVVTIVNDAVKLENRKLSTPLNSIKCLKCAGNALSSNEVSE